MELFDLLRVYDWITVIYVGVGIIAFIWAGVGNEFVYFIIEWRNRKLKDTSNKKRKCDLYFEEFRRSWMRNQNIWISVEYFLVGFSYLSMVIVIYMSVDNIIIDGDILKAKTTIYTILNLLASALRDYLQPKKKALGARQAYLLLDKKILEYEYQDASDKDLVDAISEGEKLITKSTYEE